MKQIIHKYSRLILVLGITASVTAGCGNDIHGKVVCFGDSITHGAKVNGHSYVWFLSREHKGVDFVNAGHNGRKTADREELLPVLKRYPDANYYLIFLGVNDLKNGTPAMVDTCVKNMRWMINQVQKNDPKARIVILAPTDINLKTMSQVNVRKKYNENTKQSLVALEKRYRELANEENLGFISLLHVVSPPNYADGLHPDSTGQKQIAAAVWQGLNRLYD